MRQSFEHAFSKEYCRVASLLTRKCWGCPIGHHSDLSSPPVCHREERSDVATPIKVRSVTEVAASLCSLR
jgi:hypothetical protein